MDKIYLRNLISNADEKVVGDLLQEKLSGISGKALKTSYSNKLGSLQQLGSTLTRDALYKRVQRACSRARDKGSGVVTLTDLVEFQPEADRAAGPSCVLSPSVSSKGSSSPSEAGSPESTEEVCMGGPPSDARGKPGRPKGSTAAQAQEDKENYKQCSDSIAYDYSTEIVARKALNQRCPKGFLSELIKAKKEEFEVTREINEATVRARVHAGNLSPSHPGVTSPL